MEILETRNRGGEVGELEQRGFFEVLGERYAEEGKEVLAAGGFVGFVLAAERGVPWDSQDIVEIHRACGGGVVVGCRGRCC